jgi:hypothetical protein
LYEISKSSFAKLGINTWWWRASVAGLRGKDVRYGQNDGKQRGFKQGRVENDEEVYLLVSAAILRLLGRVSVTALLLRRVTSIAGLLRSTERRSR